MKRFLFFIMSLFISFGATSCECFEDVPDIKKVGTGYIQDDSDLMFVEIDGVKYHPQSIYTDKVKGAGKGNMSPVKGMEVTVFYTDESSEPCFIAGDKSVEYLKNFFTKNYTIVVIFVTLFIISMLIMAIPNEKFRDNM